MKTHRIPRHVTGYQGRIIGRLSPKQFIYLAIGGISIFFVFTVVPLSFATIIIVSLIGLFTFTFALASIEERSLDEWALNFLLALQSTPQYIWRKEEKIPEILDPAYQPHIPHPGKEKLPASQQKLNNFLEFWRSGKGNGFTRREEEFLQNLKNIQVGESAASSPTKLSRPVVEAHTEPLDTR